MNIEIANRLIELRKKKGLSQEELANLLGVSRQAVSKWERAEASPDTDNLICLAKIYGISLDELLNIKPENKNEDNIDKDNYKSNIHIEGSVDDGEGNKVYIGKNGVHIKSKDNGEVHIGLNGIDIHQNDDDDDDDNDDDDDDRKSFHFSFNKSNKTLNMIKRIFDIATPFLCTIAYILMGFFLPNQVGWSQTWIVFLLIPIVPSIFVAIEHRSFCSFCYPVLVAGIYLILGMVLKLWHPYWFLFLTIPVYYAIFGPVDKALHTHNFKKQSIDVKVKEVPYEEVDEDIDEDED